MILSGLTRNEILANATVFLAAGYETTATALQFFSYNMALYPEIQEKVCFSLTYLSAT